MDSGDCGWQPSDRPRILILQVSDGTILALMKGLFLVMQFYVRSVCSRYCIPSHESL